MIQAQPAIVGSAELEALVAEAEAQAAAAAASAGAAAAAESDAIAAAAAVSNMALKRCWIPGWTGPDLVLLDADYNLAWGAQSNNEAIAALQAAGSLKFKRGWVPGVTGGLWVVDAVGGVLSAPPDPAIVGAVTLSGVLNDTPRAFIRRSMNAAAARPRLLGTTALGQSLSIDGGTYTPANLDTTPRHPGRTLMPDAGMWARGKTWTALRDNVEEYYTGFHDSQGSNPTGASESITGTVAFVDRLYELMVADFPSQDPLVAGFVEGLGGTPIENLMPGSRSYEDMLGSLERARDYARSQGWDFYVPFGRWIHGNDNLTDTSAISYQHSLIELRRCFSEDLRRLTGQTEDFVFYISQVCPAQSTFAAQYQPKQVQLDICRRLPQFFRGCVPAYDLNSPDGTHRDSANYRLMGYRDAEFAYRDYFRGGLGPFAVTRKWWTAANKLMLEINVPVPPIVIDTSGTYVGVTGLDWSHGGTAAGAAGFEYDDGTGSTNSPYVSAVSIVDDGTTVKHRALVELTMAGGALTGGVSASGLRRRLLIACRGTPQGPTTGGRSLIRDSAPGTSSRDRSGSLSSYPLYNWMSSSEEDVP